MGPEMRGMTMGVVRESSAGGAGSVAGICALNAEGRRQATARRDAATRRREAGMLAPAARGQASAARQETSAPFPHLTNVLVYLIENARPDDSGVLGIRFSSRSVCNPSLYTTQRSVPSLK